MVLFIKQLFLIRLKQLWRSFLSVGWLLLLALPLGILFLLIIWEKAGSLDPFAAGLILTFLVFTTHRNRKDLAFLRKCEVQVHLILFLEYELVVLLLFSLPVYIISGQWQGPLWCQLMIVPIVLLPIRPASKMSRAFSLPGVPKRNFEWKSGIRRYWGLLLPIYLAGIAFANTIPGPLVSMLLALLLALGFYDELENRILLESQLEPGFLMKKWAAHTRFFLLLFLPHTVLFLIFHWSYGYLMGLLWLISGIFLAGAIFYKYSAFLPRRQTSNNQTSMSLLILALLIPFMMPVALVAIVLWYRKAKRRLNYFFPYAGH